MNVARVAGRLRGIRPIRLRPLPHLNGSSRGLISTGHQVGVKFHGGEIVSRFNGLKRRGPAKSR